MTDWDRAGYDQERYLSRKDELLKIVGSECVICGSMDSIEFDHIDPSTKEYALMSRWNRPLSEILGEAKKCQPLCHVCHKDKTAQERSVEHGQGVTGKRNCRCGPCRELKNAYKREWRKRRNEMPV